MHFGIKPVFVDIDLETLQINIDQIKKNFKKYKSYNGSKLDWKYPDWRKIFLIAKKYKLKIIEDSADTLGATIIINLQVFLAIYQSLVFMVHMLLVVLVMVEYC